MRRKKRQAPTGKGFFLYDDHPMVTRRDFLAAGLIPFTASVIPLSLLTQLFGARSAHAACAGSGPVGPVFPAFVQLNLAGGASIGSNFVPRSSSGGLIANMDLMGLGNSAAAVDARLVSEFGTVAPSFFNTVSTNSLIAGLLETATAPTRTNTAVFAVVAQGRDDTNLNPLDIAGLVAAAGLKGSMLPALSSSGFSHMPTLIKPATPLTVNSFQDIASAVGVAGPLGTIGTGPADPARSAVFRLIDRLSESQAARFLGESLRDVGDLQDLIGCATEANVGTAGSALPTSPPVDPRTSAIAAAWGITAGSNAGSEPVVFAASILNALVGRTGPVKLQRGGYDYHNGTRATGDTKDREAGQVVGRALESARILGQPLFLFLSTDGATRSEQSAALDSPWVSDRGQASVTLVFVYDPAGRPATQILDSQNAALRNQIGFLTSGQSADNNYTSGWNAERAGTAVFANYLAWAMPKAGLGTDWRTLLNQILAGGNAANPFTAAELTRVMRLASS